MYPFYTNISLKQIGCLNVKNSKYMYSKGSILVLILILVNVIYNVIMKIPHDLLQGVYIIKNLLICIR